MSLISTIGSLATNNFSNTFEDLGKNIKNIFFDSNDYASSSTISDTTENNNVNIDLRGRNCVFRGTEAYGCKHFDMEKDYYWYNSAFKGSLFELIKPKILKIKIYLFQPFEQTFFGQMKALFGEEAASQLNSAYNLQQKQQFKAGNTGLLKVDNLDNTNFGGSLLLDQVLSQTPVLKELGDFVLNKKIEEYSRDPDLLYGSENMINMSELNPFAAIKNMFIDGIWLNTYTIPLITKLYQYAYSTAAYKGLSGGGGLFSSLGKLAGISKENKDQLNNMFKNIPSTPAYDQGLKARDKITTEFYLINENNLYLIRNYTFMQNFITGTMPVSLLWGISRPPNVYYVEILGKRLMVWAQINVSVSEIGRYKKNQYVSTKLRELSKAKSIDSNTLWPEAWKLKIDITDFTPNTFNAYLHYLTHGPYITSFNNSYVLQHELSFNLLRADNDNNNNDGGPEVQW